MKTRYYRFKPAVELLECRQAPAVITVTTTADDLNPGDGTVSLREAIRNNDHTALFREAHAIKGSTGVFGPSAALDTALRLETLAREGNIPVAMRECAQLEADLDRLAGVLRQVAGV